MKNLFSAFFKRSRPVTVDKQPFVDRMLETENLTDELVDEDANWLLNWGIANLDQVLAGATDAESAGEKVNALMAVMRKINRISAVYSQKSSADLAQDLVVLQDLYAAAFNRPIAISPEHLQDFAKSLGSLPTRQALEELIQLGKV